MAEATKRYRCTCTHPYQDKKYGKSMRLCNLMANGQYRCTVCSNIHGSPTRIEIKKKGNK